MSDERPNILFIMTDQQRWDTLGCIGNHFVETPNIDKLAAAGITFPQAFTPWPVCTPARASTWTGLYPSTHRIVDNVYNLADALSAIAPDHPTLFHSLKSAGYTTAHVGKWHLGEHKPAFFDYYVESFNSLVSHWVDDRRYGKYRPELQTDKLLTLIQDELVQKQPFAVVQSFYPPHDDFTAPKRFLDIYRRKRVPFPGYYAAVSAIDHEAGRLLDFIERLGLRENTVVFFFSDHGETFLYREDGEHKFVCFDEAIRVPFIVSWPGTWPAGQTRDHMVGLLDLFPTALEIAGVARSGKAHGTNLVPAIEQSDAAWRDSIYVQNTTWVRKMDQRCLRTRDWKLVGDAGGAHRLFNLADDPEEELDLFFAPRPDPMHRFRHVRSHAAEIQHLADLMAQAARKVDDALGVEIAELVSRTRCDPTSNAERARS